MVITVDPICSPYAFVLGAPLWLARGLVKLVPAVAYHFCSICLQHSRNHVRTIKGCPVDKILEERQELQ